MEEVTNVQVEELMKNVEHNINELIACIEKWRLISAVGNCPFCVYMDTVVRGMEIEVENACQICPLSIRYNDFPCYDPAYRYKGWKEDAIKILRKHLQHGATVIKGSQLLTLIHRFGKAAREREAL